MDKTYPPEAWRRLGKLLEQRRGQLGYGFRQREQFLTDRGGPPPSVKMLARLERGERTSYPEGTITLLESLYDYEPGSFEAVLDGGEPVPSYGHLRAVRDDGRAPADDGTSDLDRALFNAVMAISAQTLKPEGVRLREIRELLRAAPDIRNNSAG